MRADAAFRRDQLHNSDQRGNEAWGRKGIAVSQTGNLPVSIYLGNKFDSNVAAVVPKDTNDIPALWAYLGSPEFSQQVRKLDPKLNVTNATIGRVPFDRLHWAAVAKGLAPLPVPSSTDPTQWLFAGLPNDSDKPLQVAVARLLGYRWPRQTGTSFMESPALGTDGLEEPADAEGIVCLSSLQSKRPAADRLRDLLSAAFASEWSAAKQNELLSQVGYSGKSIEDWLRDGFFEQHCELFHQRPFIWHVWDGLRDGFHTFINCHKLAAPNGEGRRTLEKLIYSYLGDWIERQRADQRNGVEGADGRLAAALHLKKELEKILEGEPPYDIFVRWKPLHDQPLGWEPDINDGVRINIRPFMTAMTLRGSRNGCILRVAPAGIRWDKADRGNEPHRSKEHFPWLWEWDGKAHDFTGGQKFDGKRWNGLHYSVKRKQEARERHSAQKPVKRAQEAAR